MSISWRSFALRSSSLSSLVERDKTVGFEDRDMLLRSYCSHPLSVCCAAGRGDVGDPGLGKVYSWTGDDCANCSKRPTRLETRFLGVSVRAIGYVVDRQVVGIKGSRSSVWAMHSHILEIGHHGECTRRKLTLTSRVAVLQLPALRLVHYHLGGSI
jgi:hypothetical protein